METSLETLCAQIAVCPDCNLAATRTKAVPGEGSSTARIMFIGEGPGYNEDRTGRPFVGAAGRFLDELLASIQLKRGDVYITNVVKCRPPQNRDPLRAEMDACDKWLRQQIALIDPPVIVTLGRFSMQKFIPGESISRIHGRPRLIDGRTIVPMLHPAAALHQERFRADIVADFARLPEILATALREQQASPPATLPEKAGEQGASAQGRLF